MGMFILHTMRVNDTLLSDGLEYSLIPRLSSPLPPGNEGTGGGGGWGGCVLNSSNFITWRYPVWFHSFIMTCVCLIPANIIQVPVWNRIGPNEAKISFMSSNKYSPSILKQYWRFQPVCGIHWACFFLTTAGVDYISVALQLSFLPGEVRKDVDLNITDDLLPEGDETFRLVLSVVSNDTVILKTTASNVTITDDDRKQI